MSAEERRAAALARLASTGVPVTHGLNCTCHTRAVRRHPTFRSAHHADTATGGHTLVGAHWHVPEETYLEQARHDTMRAITRDLNTYEAPDRTTPEQITALGRMGKLTTLEVDLTR